MDVVSWSNSVNTKFYGYNKQPEDNSIQTEYASGRKVTILKNTRFVDKISCSLRLRVSDELPAFWSWYKNTLGGLAGAFTCEALGSSYYQFSSVPTEKNTDRTIRQIELEIVEVY